MLTTTLTTNQAANLLMDDTYANWSRDGAVATVEYLEQLSEDMSTDFEVDVVAIRCKYAEYDSLSDIMTDFREDEEAVQDRIIATDNATYWIVDCEM